MIAFNFLSNASLIRYISQLFNYFHKTLKTNISSREFCLLFTFWHIYGPESYIGSHPLTRSSHIITWYWRGNLNLVQKSENHTNFQSDVILTVLDYLVFTNNAVSFWDLNLSRYGQGDKPTEVGISPVQKHPPKWVFTTRKNLSTIDGKESFHMDPRSRGNLSGKASQNSSHACQIVVGKHNNK